MGDEDLFVRYQRLSRILGRSPRKNEAFSKVVVGVWRSDVALVVETISQVCQGKDANRMGGLVCVNLLENVVEGRGFGGLRLKDSYVLEVCQNDCCRWVVLKCLRNRKQGI